MGENFPLIERHYHYVYAYTSSPPVLKSGETDSQHLSLFFTWKVGIFLILTLRLFPLHRRQRLNLLLLITLRYLDIGPTAPDLLPWDYLSNIKLFVEAHCLLISMSECEHTLGKIQIWERQGVSYK